MNDAYRKAADANEIWDSIYDIAIAKLNGREQVMLFSPVYGPVRLTHDQNNDYIYLQCGSFTDMEIILRNPQSHKVPVAWLRKEYDIDLRVLIETAVLPEETPADPAKAINGNSELRRKRLEELHALTRRRDSDHDKSTYSCYGQMNLYKEYKTDNLKDDTKVFVLSGTVFVCYIDLNGKIYCYNKLSDFKFLRRYNHNEDSKIYDEEWSEIGQTVDRALETFTIPEVMLQNLSPEEEEDVEEGKVRKVIAKIKNCLGTIFG